MELNWDTARIYFLIGYHKRVDLSNGDGVRGTIPRGRCEQISVEEKPPYGTGATSTLPLQWWSCFDLAPTVVELL
jgi:hypothetical protein